MAARDFIIYPSQSTVAVGAATGKTYPLGVVDAKQRTAVGINGGSPLFTPDAYLAGAAACVSMDGKKAFVCTYHSGYGGNLLDFENEISYSIPGGFYVSATGVMLGALFSPSGTHIYQAYKNTSDTAVEDAVIKRSIADGSFTIVPVRRNIISSVDAAGRCSLAPTPDGSKFVVMANFTSVTAIAIVDTATDAVTYHSLAAKVRNDAVFAGNGKIYMATQTAPYLDIYDPSTSTLTTISGGNLPGVAFALALSNDGSTIAVLHAGGTGLTFIDLATGNRRAALSGLNIASSYSRWLGAVFLPGDTTIYVGHNAPAFVDVATGAVQAQSGTFRARFAGPLLLRGVGGAISNEDTTPVVDAMNQPVQRAVRVLARTLGGSAANTAYVQQVGATVSDASGRYEIPMLTKNDPMMVIFEADNDTENSVVVDWVYPE